MRLKLDGLSKGIVFFILVSSIFFIPQKILNKGVILPFYEEYLTLYPWRLATSILGFFTSPFIHGDGTHFNSNILLLLIGLLISVVLAKYNIKTISLNTTALALMLSQILLYLFIFVNNELESFGASVFVYIVFGAEFSALLKNAITFLKEKRKLPIFRFVLLAGSVVSLFILLSAGETNTLIAHRTGFLVGSLLAFWDIVREKKAQ